MSNEGKGHPAHQRHLRAGARPLRARSQDAHARRSDPEDVADAGAAAGETGARSSATRAASRWARTPTSRCSIPATVIDKSTYQSPAAPAVGFKFVLVNGVPVVRDGSVVGRRFPGASGPRAGDDDDRPLTISSKDLVVTSRAATRGGRWPSLRSSRRSLPTASPGPTTSVSRAGSKRSCGNTGPRRPPLRCWAAGCGSASMTRSSSTWRGRPRSGSSLGGTSRSRSPREPTARRRFPRRCTSRTPRVFASSPPAGSVECTAVTTPISPPISPSSRARRWSWCAPARRRYSISRPRSSGSRPTASRWWAGAPTSFPHSSLATAAFGSRPAWTMRDGWPPSRRPRGAMASPARCW